MAPGREVNGCYIANSTCFIFVFLTLSLAVGVGILVHFIGHGSSVTYNYQCPLPAIVDDDSNDVLERNGRTASCDWDQCRMEAKNRSICLVQNCAESPVTSYSGVSETTAAPPKVKLSHRLPRALFPVSYTLELKPNMYEGDPGNFTFDGSEEILINCSQPTQNITLNNNGIVLHNDSIHLGLSSQWCAGTPPHVTDFEQDTERQFLIFHLNGTLRPGCQYSLNFDFTGPLRDDLAGLYYSSYQRENNTIYMATTLFSPLDARKAFPCFDEPALKAVFNVVLVRKDHMVTISNMPILRNETRDDGFIADVYQPTPPMSTYLLVFITCDFHYIENTTRNGTTVRFWARPEFIDQLDFAMNTGVQLVQFFEDYIGVPYMLPKLDFAAIPDFRVSGMENWGTITFKERSLLYDPRKSSADNKENIVRVISHEIVHLWFGDFVTPAWWSELWLKEGFASFLEYTGINHAFKDWQIWDLFPVYDMHRVFLSDSLGSSHPIVQPVDTANEVRMVFNSIPYAKGASLMRMMSYIFGEETYRRALKIYLQSLAYGSAVHEDLWDALQKSLPSGCTHLNVTAIMDTWVLQKNYPVVMVKRKGENSLQISQTKFRADAEIHAESSVFGYRWHIPFTYTTSEERDFEHGRITYLQKDDMTTTITSIGVPPLNNSASWVIGNVKQYGYYRVNYDVMNWRALIQQLKANHTEIHPINRAQIINDAWNLAKAGMLDQRLALGTVEYLDKETSYVPWTAANVQLSALDKILIQTGIYGDFKKFMRNSILPLFNSLGWNYTGSSHLESLLRSSIVRLACKYGLEDCVQKSMQYFQDWMNRGNDSQYIQPEIRTSMYCTAIQYGSDREWEFAYRKYKEESSATEKKRLLIAMACSRETWVLSRYLELAVTPTEVRKQDAVNIIVYISKNPIGRSLTWSFVVSRWNYIMETYGSGLFSFAKLISGITDSFSTEDEYKQLVNFMLENPDQAIGSRSLLQAVEKTMANIYWLRSNKKLVADWLHEQLHSR